MRRAEFLGARICCSCKKIKKYWQVIDKILDSLIEKSQVTQDETWQKSKLKRKLLSLTSCPKYEPLLIYFTTP